MMSRMRHSTYTWAGLLSLVWMASVANAAEPLTGEQIFRQRCAACHGAKGEGVAKHYGKPLAGDRSLGELTKQIEKTMPEDDPGTCVGEDARRVASYIYDAFYSPVAQARNRPVRVELSRLTVRQYRQSVADLVGSFRFAPPAWGNERGLQGQYFKSRRQQKGERAIDRLDPAVDFDFGESSPDKDQIPTDEFSIRWEGSVLAPESGEYEFILEVQNGARLWVNNLNTPLIDGGVRSGKDVARSESIRLLGGRAYPLRVEMFKSKQAKDKTAAIRLKWRPPGQAAEIIPARCLTPQRFPEVWVAATPFPPDDRSVGYERGTSVSQAWDQATADAAIETAAYVTSRLNELAGTRDGAPDRSARLKDFCGRWAARAFRRPITPEERKFYVERWFDGAKDDETAVRRALMLTLMSPRFLYLDLDGSGGEGYDIAARLAFGLWDSLPDEPLLRAAASGQLKTPDQVRRQVERMLADSRTRGKLHDFFLLWLNTDRFTDIAKDSKRFPEFDEQIVSDLRTALNLFLDDVAWSDSSDFRQLLQADWLYLNGRLAKFYGVELPADAPFQKATLQRGQRAGVLTHPYLMAGLAYTSSSSPIHRGVFVARSVLGRSLRPPPEAVAPLPVELHADLTTRQRVTLQTKAESCQSCHRMINPLGFAFENFDAVGRFRSREQGQPIDATGAYQTRTGDTVRFANVRDLANYLAGSEETHEAFVEQLFHYVVKQPIGAYGPHRLSELEKSFVEQKFNMRRLLIDIVVVSALETPDRGGPPKTARNP